MTPQELARLRAEHVQASPPLPHGPHKTDGPQCQADRLAWPCVVKRLLDHIEASHG